MAASTQRTARTPDGRTLAIEEAGDPGGRPVLVHNGTPNSRHLYAPAAAAAAARGLRLIGYDRPGYGGSTPQPGRTVADCAADVRAICAELCIDRLAMWGISGGGPHVLACAALLPDLVTAAASLASLAPANAEGLDWFEGMGQENVDDFQAAGQRPGSGPCQAGIRPRGHPGRIRLPAGRTREDPADADRRRQGYVVVPPPRRISGVILYCMLASN